MSDMPQTQYAKHGDSHIAYQVVGEGPPDIVFMRSAYNHIELQWEEPRFARFLRRLASFGRLIVFDVRGSGLSDPFSRDGIPTIEDWADDTLAVMDEVGSERAVVVATGVGSTRALVLAATHPERVSSLVICNGFARLLVADDYPLGVTEDVLANNRAFTQTGWGRSAPPGLAESDPVLAAWEPRYRRYACSPGTAEQIGLTGPRLDVRHVLPAIHTPTLVISHEGHSGVGVAGAIGPLSGHLADNIAGATRITINGRVLLEWRFDDPDAVADEIQRFVGAEHVPAEADRVLATVLFTDIVDSTRSSVDVGDRSWSDRLDALDRVVAEEVGRYRGRVVKFTGDGHLATFDGPGRAIRCGSALKTRVAHLGLTLRSGLHTGEVEVRGDDIGGIAVSIARRVCDAADDGCVFVSSAVPPLVAGSPIEFDDRGEHELKGVPGRWQLYAVKP